MRYRRNIFTGVLEQVTDNPQAEFDTLNRAARERVRHLASGRSGAIWYKDKVCKAMSIKPEEATPERVARENADAKRQGTGATYDPDGQCWIPTRGSRSKEMRRRRMQDNDSGYGDWAGR